MRDAVMLYQGANPGNKELLQVRQEFMLTAMRTYLQAVKDRRPAVLESKKPMPRAKILEFFDVCNTRMDLPDTHKELLTYLAVQKKVPNELIISMQRELLEDMGFEQEHGCAVLSRIGQDFPNDAEMAQKLQMWKSKAEQSCMRAVRAHQEAGGELPEMQTMVIDKELSAAMEKVIPKAKEQIGAMSEEEKNAFLGEKAMKKMEVFQQLPPDGRLAWIKRLSDEDKLEFVKIQVLFVEHLKKRMQAGQQVPQSGYAAAPCTMDAAQGPSRAPAQEQMM
ncbi:unnamed protein product [Symbiodinium natans]|uniref:Uncharacterized protein n=1 Tax=Symbiodinium natans TaxID=878477 RepID=A0A812QPT1_9DINO|nr:unnamed protein product [Symbiodinium natans]